MGWMPYTAEDGSQQLSPGYVAGDQRPTSDGTATPAAADGEAATDSSERSAAGTEATSATVPPSSDPSSSENGSPATAAPEGMEWLLVPKTSGMHSDAA